MSDETKPTTPSGTDSTETVEGAVLVAEVSDETGVQAEAVIATDFTHTIIVAAFANQDSAMETYEALRDAEVSQSLHIDAVAVVRADGEGKIHAQKVTEHSTKKGLKWGVGAGIVLAVIFPPSLLAGAVAGGVAGGAIGKIRHTTRLIELEKELRGSLPPDSSGIVALFDTVDAAKVKETMPKATKVTEKPVDDATAKEVEQAAKEGEATPA
jgi:uncharacterized membrane protein